MATMSRPCLMTAWPCRNLTVRPGMLGMDTLRAGRNVGVANTLGELDHGTSCCGAGKARTPVGMGRSVRTPRRPASRCASAQSCSGGWLMQGQRVWVTFSVKRHQPDVPRVVRS